MENKNEVIRNFLQERGAILLKEVVSFKDRIRILCPSCKKEFSYVSFTMLKAQNPKALCVKCKQTRTYSFEYVKELLCAKGSDLIEYNNSYSKIIILCSVCKKPYSITSYCYMKHRKMEPICSSCKRPKKEQKPKKEKVTEGHVINLLKECGTELIGSYTGVLNSSKNLIQNYTIL